MSNCQTIIAGKVVIVAGDPLKHTKKSYWMCQSQKETLILLGKAVSAELHSLAKSRYSV